MAAPQAQPAMFDDSLKCTMCMDLCARPVTVSESTVNVSCTTTLNRSQVVLLLLAGSLPAQLLSCMFEKMGGPG